MSDSSERIDFTSFNFDRYVDFQLEESFQVLQWFKTESNLDMLKMLSEKLIMSFNSGGKLILFGNGGSAAEATHIAAEFVSKCIVDNGPWPALALNDSISSLTAISNDFGFEKVFSRQIEAFAQSNDVVIGLSTSGTSVNVINGLKTAKAMGVYSVLFTSSKYRDKHSEIDLVIKSNSQSTPRTQEFHLFLGHILAEICEQFLPANE